MTISVGYTLVFFGLILKNCYRFYSLKYTVIFRLRNIRSTRKAKRESAKMEMVRKRRSRGARRTSRRTASSMGDGE